MSGGRVLAAIGEPRDRDIIALCREGKDEGFRQLVETHHEYVLRLCWRMLGDREEAHDAAQEVFLRVIRSLDRLDPRPSLRPWLRRVATNICLNAASRRSRQAAVPLEEEVVEMAVGLDSRGGGGDPVSREAQTRLDLDSVAREMDRLSRQQRMVLVLRVVEDMSYEAIGQLMGLPTGTVKSHLSRARAQLREALLV